MKRQITKLSGNRFLQTSLCLIFTLFFSTKLMAQAPSIVNTLLDKIVCENTSPTWAVTATNATTYQWEVNTGGGFVPVVNGANYSGATTSVLKLMSVPTSFTGNKYRCTVTGPSLPNAVSNEATLTVTPNASIVTEPTEFVTVCKGAIVPLTVVTAGSVTTYQWQVYNPNTGTFFTLNNNATYSGVATATLSINFATAIPNTATYIYKCQINGSCTGTSTKPSNVTVKAPPTITQHPISSTICAGSSTNFEVMNNGSDVTYQWQVSYGGPWANITNNATYSGTTTRALSVISNSGLNGTQYRCVLNGACTPSATSSAATLTVDELVSITADPANAIVCPGNSTNFVVVATGTDLTYQWQINDGISGWTNLTNTGVHSDVTTNTLLVSAVTLASNGHLYRCNVSGKCSNNVFSNPKSLTVNTPIAITSQPTNKIICSGQSTTLNTSATGSGVFTYVWYITDGITSTPLADGGIYAGTSTGTLNINGITAGPSAETFSYFCDVNNMCGGQSTVVAYVTVNALPAVTLQPVNTDICDGLNADLEVDATGTNLTYQWQVNAGSHWSDITNDATYSNATTRILSILSNPSLDGVMYRCNVSGTCSPTASSSAATLTVYDNINITAQPTNKTICPGTATNFSVTATGTGIAYQWQVNDGVSGWTDLTNTGIYSGATTNTLYLTNVTPTYHEYLYRCNVSGTCFASNVATASVELRIDVPVSITTQPTNKTICSGTSTTLTTVAAGTGITTYEWYIINGATSTPLTNGGFYSDVATATLSINNITTGSTSAQTLSYFCKVTGTCGGASTNPAYVTVNALPAIATHPTDMTICSGFNTSFSVTATGTNPTYQWQVNTGVGGWTNVTNTGIYSNTTTRIINLTGATTTQNGYQYRCAVSGDCTPTANSNGAILNINTAPAITANPTDKAICVGGNTNFEVNASGAGLTYQWQVDNGSGWANIANVGIYSDATTAALTLTAAGTGVNGYKYRCIVSGTCLLPANSAAATLTIDTPPAIATHPSATATCPGGNASFSVSATGTALTYQWEVNTGGGWSNVTNTGIYSNATTSTLNLTGATNPDDGNQYRCSIAGTCTPSTTSNAAELDINIVPSISSSPINSIICLNGNTTFAVTAAGTGLTYQWQVSTGAIWSNLLNTGVYGGVTTPTLSITSAPKLIDGYMYRCIITGTCSPVLTSGTGTLTVNDPTVLVNSPTAKIICPSSNTSFSVSATGTSLGYQWEVNTGSGWMNVTNVGVYSGATTNKLTLTNVQTTFNTYQYRCKVTGTCAPTSLTSSAATLTVHTIIVIGTQPAATKTICSGDNTTLTVAATGTGIGYQWYLYNGTSYVAIANNATYSGAATSTLSMAGLTASPSAKVYSYRCLVSGTCNSVNTVPSYVTVQAKPVVTSNPTNVTVCDSTNNISYSVAATGTNLTYQWQVKASTVWNNISNNSTYSGATTKKLTIQQVLLSMNSNEYRCIVSGSCTPPATSAAAGLGVNPLLLSTVSISQNKNDVCKGTLISFTATPTNGGTSPVYRWKVNNVTVLTTSSSLFNTTTLSDNDIVSCSMTSNVTCISPSTATANSNQLTMQITEYQTPTATISSPSGTSACSGVPVIFNAANTYGGAMPSYQWRVNGSPVGTDSAAFSTTSLDSNDLVSVVLTSNFKCPNPTVVASNTIKMLITQTKIATVSIAAGTDTSVCKGAPVELYAYYTHSGANPSFEWFRNGGRLAGQASGTLITSQVNQDDVFTCRFISSEICVPPVTSAPLKFNLDNPVQPSVDVQVVYNGDNSYKFTATPTNGGTNPSYQWYANGTLIGNAIHPTYTTSLLVPSTLISVVMTSNHPCVSTLNATSRNITTGIADDKLLFDNMALYPNPNSGTFVLAGEYNGVGTGDAVITITNTLGQQVYKTEAQVAAGKLKHTVNMSSDPAAGTYIIRIQFEGKQDIRRFNIVR